MGRHRSNLPAEVTSFVGRRRELREVKRLLTTTRLLTLTGSGGVGKTKLALRAATEMSRGFPDGAWLVLLDSIHDPMLVTQATFSALGLQDRSAGWSLSTLTEYLAGQRLLLVLDNCEHLLDGCAVLASTLISACPDLQRMSGERDNLWAALDFCSSDPAEVAAGAEAAQHLMAYWASCGPFGDVRRVLTSLADLAPENSLPRARLLWVAAVMATNQNDTDACRALSGESLRIGTEVKDVEVAAWSLLVAAIPRWRDGDLAGATEQIDSALSLARLMHLDHVELNALDALCPLLAARGELDRAVDVGEQGLALSQDRGELWMRGYLLTFLAQATWRQGHRSHAEALAREAATCKLMIDDRHGLTMVLETLAWMATECGRHGRAATLLGCAEQVRGQIAVTLMDVYRPQHDRSVTATVHAIGEKAFDAAFARGRAMTIDEGAAFAVADEQAPKAVPSVKAVSHTELTRRQLEIARLIAEDLTNRQIADQLFCPNGRWKPTSPTCSTSSASTPESSSAAGWPNCRRRAGRSRLQRRAHAAYADAELGGLTRGASSV